MLKKLKAYALCVTRKDFNTSVTWCEEYNFDPFKEIVQIIGKNGEELGVIDLKEEGFLKLDVYDKTKPTDNLVQTILSGRNAS